MGPGKLTILLRPRTREGFEEKQVAQAHPHPQLQFRMRAARILSLSRRKLAIQEDTTIWVGHIWSSSEYFHPMLLYCSFAMSKEWIGFVVW